MIDDLLAVIRMYPGYTLLVCVVAAALNAKMGLWSLEKARLYFRSIGWTPSPELQHRLLRFAKWAHYGYRGVTVMLGLAAVLYVLFLFWRYSVQELRSVADLVLLMVWAFVALWVISTLMLKMAERTLRSWADPAAPRPVFPKKPTPAP